LRYRSSSVSGVAVLFMCARKSWGNDITRYHDGENVSHNLIFNLPLALGTLGVSEGKAWDSREKLKEQRWKTCAQKKPTTCTIRPQRTDPIIGLECPQGFYNILLRRFPNVASPLHRNQIAPKPLRWDRGP